MQHSSHLLCLCYTTFSQKLKRSAVLLNIAIIRGIYERRRIKKILFRAAKNCAGKEKIMLDKRVLYGYNNSRDGQLAQLV